MTEQPPKPGQPRPKPDKESRRDPLADVLLRAGEVRRHVDAGLERASPASPRRFGVLRVVLSIVLILILGAFGFFAISYVIKSLMGWMRHLLGW